jgi:hypothetical protein
MTGLRPVIDDGQLAVLRILADRRRSLGEDHTRMISQLHQLLLELIPGRAKKALSAAQAKVLLAAVRPRDAAGRARRRVAAELISDLECIYQRKKAADKELRDLLKTTGTTLTSLNGIGPSGAARLLAEIGDVTRFPDKAHFASWNGTAPIDASSGDQVRHRLSRAGNRQINRALHIMAVVQLRNPTEGPTTTQSRRGHRGEPDPVDPGAEDAFEVSLEAAQPEQAQPGREVGKQVHVAVGAVFAAGHAAEYAQVADPMRCCGWRPGPPGGGAPGGPRAPTARLPPQAQRQFDDQATGTGRSLRVRADGMNRSLDVKLRCWRSREFTARPGRARPVHALRV